ncbi:hypothetical protein ACH5RR_026480 [Cinchona calisaya]|uniref:Uncharacterized protein n=1 Tax=Cinchona calisaya TaxID=153742 RepID=A0ABD2Z2P2_9GENT
MFFYALGQAKLFEPEIKRGFSIFFQEQGWGTVRQVGLLNFISCVNKVNLMAFEDSNFQVVAVKKLMILVRKKLQFLQRLLGYHPWEKRQGMRWYWMRSLLLHVAQAATTATYFSYSCWVDGLDQIVVGDMEMMLSHLLEQIMPHTPKLVEIFF